MDLINFSISPEVYVINLIIGVVVFFILRWVLRKIVKTSRRLRTTLLWAGTIVLTPIIYVVLILVMLSAMFYQPTRDFNSERWFANKESRYEMRDDIVKSKLLNDKTKKEVLDILGPPDFGTDSTNAWHYDLGTSGAGFGWQFNSLIVTFKNDQVEKVEKEEIVD